jgi:hypothetical protein
LWPPWRSPSAFHSVLQWDGSIKASTNEPCYLRCSPLVACRWSTRRRRCALRRISNLALIKARCAPYFETSITAEACFKCAHSRCPYSSSNGTAIVRFRGRSRGAGRGVHRCSVVYTGAWRLSPIEAGRFIEARFFACNPASDDRRDVDLPGFCARIRGYDRLPSLRAGVVTASATRGMPTPRHGQAGFMQPGQGTGGKNTIARTSMLSRGDVARARGFSKEV